MGFKTSLLGFHKGDVLACIDRMAAENLEQQRQAEQRAAALEDQLGTLKAEKDGLETRLEESTHAVVQAAEQAAAQQKRAEEAETRATALNEQLTHMETRAQDYKKRLFVREEEAVVLRRDNTRLTETLREKQQELETMLAQLNAAKKDCEEKLAAMQQQAEQTAAQAQADAEADVRAAARRAEETVQQAQQQAA